MDTQTKHIHRHIRTAQVIICNNSSKTPKFVLDTINTHTLLLHTHTHTRPVTVGALFATPPPPPYRRERFDTPDGDFFTVDFLDSRDQRRAPRGLVFLYHGLEANTLSPLAVSVYWSF